MPLQVKHRPKTLQEFKGNSAVVESLESVLSRKKDVPSSFLFTGKSGCGKTTLARIIKERLECSDSDFFYYNSANTRGIDTVRAIQENCVLAPMMGKVKIYVLDECHQITGQAQEALLLLLEEPPKHVHFILCTTEPEKLKPTIKRRCHQYEVEPLAFDDMMELLKETLVDELGTDGADEFPRSILERIVKLSEGSAGQAMKLLDEVIDVLDEDKALKVLDKSSGNEHTVIELCRLLVDEKTKPETKWGEAIKIIKGIEEEPEIVRHMILGYLNKVVLNNNKDNPINAIRLLANFCDNYYNSKKSGLILSVYFSCFEK